MSEKIIKLEPPLRVGVVGVGHLGRFHAQKYLELDGVELVGIYDIDPNQAEKVATELGIELFRELDTLFAQVQAISIATPTSTHFELARQALDIGLDVLVEKPITTTTDEAKTLVELARKHQRILQVGLLERFNPVFTKTRQYLKNPRFIEVHRLAPFSFRSLDIDVILDLMIHDIDLVHELTNSPATSIDAVGVPVISEQIDIANIRIHFANGAIANLTASRVSLNRERRIRIFQPNGYFSLDFANFTATVCQRLPGGKGFGPLPEIKARELKFPAGDNLKAEIADFIAAVRQRRPPVVDGAAGLRALETAFRIKEAIKLQQGTWL